MARPRQAEVREASVTVRLTLPELIALRERAARAGQSVSDYVRTRALTASNAHRSAAPQLALEPASYIQVKRLGVNLNQIARRLNAQDLPAPPELAPLLAEIHATLRQGLGGP